jgi:aldehyde:ferredoxin oxidoreductase
MTNVNKFKNRVGIVLPYAYAERILHVDLTTRKYTVEPLNLVYARKYIGGKGLAARYLFDLLKPGTDPLGPENVLIIMTGPLTGTLAPAAGKYCVVTKSPLTGIWLDSYAGGYFAPELKYAGFDGVVIFGRAAKPTYLFIDDGEVEFRDAEGLMGKTTSETDKAVKEELGDETIKVMCIGPAGERLSRIAVISSCGRHHGRGGAGAVMGAKNLKAIAVRGTGGVTVACPEEFLRTCEESIKKDVFGDPNAEFGRSGGTPEILMWAQEAGCLPTRNYSNGQFEGASKIDATAVLELAVRRRACFQCPIACSRWIRVPSGPYIGTEVEGPEFETLYSLGANCGIDRLDAIAKANFLCDELGLDTISVGVTIAWVMECYEKGILTPNDTGGIELEFGNHEAMITLIEKIGKREGIGDILADGVALAAQRIGSGSERYAVHVKGLELPGYDPRASPAMGLAYATADRGGCHLRAWPVGVEAMGATGSFWMGTPIEIDRWSPKNKAMLVIRMQHQYAAKFSLIICDFCCWNNEHMTNLLWTATGFNEYKDVRMFELAGERITNLIRVINVLEGITRKDDTLPPKIFEDPLKSGPAKGRVLKREDFEKMITDYYELREWDAEGRPILKKLKELDMEDIIPKITWLGGDAR